MRYFVLSLHILLRFLFFTRITQQKSVHSVWMKRKGSDACTGIYPMCSAVPDMVSVWSINAPFVIALFQRCVPCFLSAQNAKKAITVWSRPKFSLRILSFLLVTHSFLQRLAEGMSQVIE